MRPAGTVRSACHGRASLLLLLPALREQVAMLSRLARMEAIPRASETVMRWETLMGLEMVASHLSWCQQADSKVQPTV